MIMGKKQIVFYTSKNGDCEPCQEITKLVEEGKFFNTETDEVDLIDISSDEGFKKFSDEILSKQPGAVPSAYMNGVKCQITVVEDEVQFECPSSAPPSSPEESPSPPAEDA